MVIYKFVTIPYRFLTSAYLKYTEVISKEGLWKDNFHT